jgi:predicted transcriptional regulator
MKKENELVLKVTKEIVVKFIEMGQLSVSSFEKVFKEVHVIVDEALKGTSETKKSEEESA